jgi:hypothetical protein
MENRKMLGPFRVKIEKLLRSYSGFKKSLNILIEIPQGPSVPCISAMEFDIGECYS